MSSHSPSARADWLANEIEQDIISRGWPVGSLLGTETDLMAQYAVSRAVFREAVRILESHGTATVRRGPRGGLVVTEPRLSAISTPVALFFESRKIKPVDVFRARVSLELAAVDLTARELTEDGILILRDLVAQEREVSDADFSHISHELHIRIAELSRNLIYPLFVSFLIDLLRNGVARGNTPQPTSEDIDAVRSIHSAIVEAIVVGDAGRAKHLLRRHLESITPWMQNVSPAFGSQSNGKAGHIEPMDSISHALSPHVC